jgi:hypothetical protein
MKSKSYWDRTDLEKVRSQWTKLSGLHIRSESSAAIVRAATAAELAATFAVRNEFKARSQFSPRFVDSLLLWSNGLNGKFERLLIPLTSDDLAKNEVFKSVHVLARKLNDKRNSIVHRGEFCNAKEARAMLETARKIIHRLVRPYDKGFRLEKCG